MAKTFNQIFKVAKETAYGSTESALVLAASLNSVVDFDPTAKSNGTAGAPATSVQYIIQRMLRIKAKEVNTPHAKSTSNDLAALDAFSEIEWESAGVATGKLRAIGVKTSINEAIDVDSIGEGHAKVIADSVKVEAAERHERLLTELMTATNKVAFAGTDMFTQLSDEASKIMLKSDKFKHMTSMDKMLIVMHPIKAAEVAKEIGTVFNQEAPIYKTGLNSKFSINGIPVIVDASLNKYEITDKTDRVGAIILDVEALAFKANDFNKPVSIDLGLTKYTGQYFYSIEKLIDDSRVTVMTFDATGKAAKTAKVSA